MTGLGTREIINHCCEKDQWVSYHSMESIPGVFKAFGKTHSTKQHKHSQMSQSGIINFLFLYCFFLIIIIFFQYRYLFPKTVKCLELLVLSIIVYIMLQRLRTPFESTHVFLKLATGLFSVPICILAIQRQMYSKYRTCTSYKDQRYDKNS